MLVKVGWGNGEMVEWGGSSWTVGAGKSGDREVAMVEWGHSSWSVGASEGGGREGEMVEWAVIVGVMDLHCRCW